MSTTEDQVAGHAGRRRARRDARPPQAPPDGPRRLPLAAYVPMGVTSDYKPPKATVDPDMSKSWIKRAYPIVASHKGLFLVALILSFVGLVLQVQIPQLLNDAIDNSLGAHPTVPLHFYVYWVLALGLIGGVAGYFSRTSLFKVAYDIEFDLRNSIYEHLTRMSFPFYDRVQSGQLISRANSDIRSVQMYLTFAPMILVQCSIAVVAFGYMLPISVPLAFVAMATMPFIYWTGVRMRKSSSRCRGSSSPGWPRWPPWSTRTSTACGWSSPSPPRSSSSSSWPRRPTRCSGATSRTPTCGPVSRP